MTTRSRQVLQGLLITAVTAALALVVFSTFRRVLEPPDPEVVAARSAQLTATTTTSPVAGGAVTTTRPDQEPEEPAGSDGTAAPGGQGGNQQGECQEREPGNAQGTVIMLFFTCGEAPVPDVTGNAYRIVPVTEARLTATLTELVRGPDGDERDLGFTSVFSDATTDVFAGVVIDGGTAIVDFVGLERIDGLDQPTVATSMVASLNATVFQFETVDAVEYRLGGSCQAFWATMGADCVTTGRRQWERQLAAWAAEG